jgi:hypothetical protein
LFGKVTLYLWASVSSSVKGDECCWGLFHGWKRHQVYEDSGTQQMSHTHPVSGTVDTWLCLAPFSSSICDWCGHHQHSHLEENVVVCPFLKAIRLE